MSPKSIFSDSLDEFFELVKSTGQQATQTAKTLTLGTAQKALEQITGQTTSTEPNNKGIEKLEKIEKPKNHTPLNVQKLQEIYQEQDREKMDKVRSKLWHFFNLQKEEERKAIAQRKREEEERKQKEEMEKEEKKREEERAKQQQPFVETPKGKERRSIFAPRKTAKRSQAETRVGAGKQ